MKLAVCICNSNNNRFRRWLTLPDSNYRLNEIIEQLCRNQEDRCIIVDYRTTLKIENIVDYDIFYLNELILKLNSCATYNEIQALTETYSTSLEDIVQKVKNGGYRFYDNKTLMQLAEEFAQTDNYQQNDEFDIYKMVNELERTGYEQTSKGVICFN